MVTFSKIDHIIGHKINFSRYKDFALIPCILWDYHRLRWIFNNENDNRKSTYMCKLNIYLLCENLVREEIKK